MHVALHGSSPSTMTAGILLLTRARQLGYTFVQLQTHGRRLADAPYARALRQAGVDALEVMLLGADAAVHDRIAGADGAFRDTATGLQLAARFGFDVLVTVPVLRRNGVHLARTMALVHRLGVRRVQLSFPRPVETRDGVPTEELLRLGPASALAARAARHAQKLGLSVSTEGFPLCRLETWLHGTPDATVFMPFAYVEAAANLLTNPALDPFGKIPEFKYCAVKVTAGGTPAERFGYDASASPA